MSSPSSRASNNLLHSCWEIVTQDAGPSSQQDQYVAEQRVLEWLNRVIAQSGHMQDLAKSTAGTKEMLNQYMKQVHKLDHQSVANVKWTYQEAVELYYFVHDRISKPKQSVEQPAEQSAKQAGKIQQKQHQQIQQNDSKIISNQSKVMNNDSKISHNDKLPAHNASKMDTSQIHNPKQMQKSQQFKPEQDLKQNQSKISQHKPQQLQPKHAQKQQEQQQQQFMYPASKNNQHQSKTEPKQQPQQQQQQTAQQQNDNEFADEIHKHIVNNQHNSKDGQVTKNYREYLLTIFEHYCRMSYSTGNDPTFEQIQHKTTVMHINKFMIFCKDFGVAKLNGMNRNVLVEMFKKNSQYFKEMNYEQFISVLTKIAKIVYGHGEEDQDKNEQQANTDSKQKYNVKDDKQNYKQFEQLLLFLEVNNFASFKKKIQSLNIKFKPKLSKQNEPKKLQPTNYKFKFAPSTDGKSEEQVRQELQQRKRIRSENKLKVIGQLNRPKNISSKKDIMKRDAEQRNINDRPQIQSTQPSRKLAPPLPPARKISNTSNNNRPPPDPTAGVTGYANIHRLKLLGKQGQVDSKMKLNTVVEEAKRMVQMNNNAQQFSDYPTSNRMPSYGRETPYSMHHQNMEEYTDRDMTQSEESSYSQRDLLAENPISRRSYAPYGHSQLEKRNKLDRSKSKGKQEDVEQREKEELLGLIGDDDDDRDEYLQEHLNREKKSGAINQRIQKKIKEFEIKQTKN